MKKGSISTILPVLMLVTGLSLLLYPSFSDYRNTTLQSRAIARYSEMVASLNEEDSSRLWSSAQAYNRSILARDNGDALSRSIPAAYEEQLNIGGKGIMGYIEIPSIHVYLPICHGTAETMLQAAVGHLEWTSLPVGGESTHCVLSGHRGLPSARLFTDLDQLAVGDCFTLNVLDKTLTYEVDRILIVEPDDTRDLLIEEGKDLCTLVTCTPYGINSHRLLVRGQRTGDSAQDVPVLADRAGFTR